MTIYHDVYLMSLDRFAEHVKPLLPILEEGQADYSPLTDSAFAAFDQNPFVRWLAAEYGGWTRKGYQEDLLTVRWQPFDIAFWLMPLLYDELLAPDEGRIGLGHLYRPLEELLASKGWNKEDRTTRVFGHPFTLFAQRWLENTNPCWEHLHPVAQSGRAGWISLNEIPDLLERLPQVMTEGQSGTASAFQTANRMLLAAQAANTDLCIIVSG